MRVCVSINITLLAHEVIAGRPRALRHDNKNSLKHVPDIDWTICFNIMRTGWLFNLGSLPGGENK